MPRTQSVQICLLLLPLIFCDTAHAQSPPKIRAAYTPIAIQMDPIYIMKELNLARKQGLEAELLYVPVSSRAIQAALAGEIQFLTSGGGANVNPNMAGGALLGPAPAPDPSVFSI